MSVSKKNYHKLVYDITGKQKYIKITKKNETNADAVLQFKHAVNEAALHLQFKNEFIVNAETFQLTKDTVTLTLEYCESMDLWEMFYRQKMCSGIKDGHLNYFIISISGALKYLEEKKILHRDIKPENIFVTKDGRLKLGDFEFVVNYETCSNIELNNVFGTHGYIAPERYTLRTQRDPSSDYWSFGVVLLELIRGDNFFYIEGKSISVNKNLTLNDDIPIPENTKYTNLLYALLNRRPTKRINSEQSLNNIIKPLKVFENILYFKTQ